MISNGGITTWDIRSFKRLDTVEGEFTDIAFSSDGRVLATVGARGLELRDTARGKALGTSDWAPCACEKDRWGSE